MEGVKSIAYYLPQFHPIPENDQWWGKGFTEWTNVTKAKPLFRGHYQPRFPADLGYYDLRIPEVREEQAKMAKEHGIHGFCYYHYWFGNGKQLLERPFNEVLRSGKPDFPFMLCWANQTWKGIWFGNDNPEVLIEQTYPGMEDYVEHFNYLVKAFKDPRYIKVDGKPVFQVYMPLDIPDLPIFINTFNELAKINDIPGIYFLACNYPDNWNPIENGFNGVVSNSFHTFRYKTRFRYFRENSILGKIEGRIRYFLGEKHISKRRKPLVFDYEKITNLISKWPKKDYDYFPLVVPDWDNSARSGKKSLILKDSTPEKWSLQLKRAKEYLEELNYKESFLFIKSWNEWAEGNYLEPDQKWGQAYLETHRSLINND